MDSTPSTNCKTCKKDFAPAYPKQVFCPGCTADFKAKQGPAATKPADAPKPATKPAKDYHPKLPCSTSGCKGKQKCAFLTKEGYAVGFCYGCLCTKLNLEPTVSKK